MIPRIVKDNEGKGGSLSPTCYNFFTLLDNVTEVASNSCLAMPQLRTNSGYLLSPARTLTASVDPFSSTFH